LSIISSSFNFKSKNFLLAPLLIAHFYKNLVSAAMVKTNTSTVMNRFVQWLLQLFLGYPEVFF